MPLISVKNLKKTFKVVTEKQGFINALLSFIKPTTTLKTAIDDISFDIFPGELVGYIGPNGAGKSTTLKILTGILLPSSGTVNTFGKTPWKHRIEVVSQIGVVFGQRSQLWWDLPVIDSFKLLRDIYKVPVAEYKVKLEELVSELQLSPLLEKPTRTLSLGERMRADIAASLLHSPKLLFLDEPTIGLDAANKIAVRDFIKKLNRNQQVTVILTTHDLDDIESLCNRVIFLSEGKIQFDGSIDLLHKEYDTTRNLIIDFEKIEKTIFDPEAIVVRQEGHRVWLRYDPTCTSTPTLLNRIAMNYQVREFYTEEFSTKDVIKKLLQKM